MTDLDVDTPTVEPEPPRLNQFAAATAAKIAKKRLRMADFERFVAEGMSIVAAMQRVGIKSTTYENWRKAEPAWAARITSMRLNAGAAQQRGTDFVGFRSIYFARDTPVHQALMVEAICSAQPDSITLINAFPEAGKTSLLIDLYCWLLGEHPNTRVCVISENQGLARKIGGQVARRMTDRTAFRAYIERFGPFKVNPDGRKRGATYGRDVRMPWNADYFTVLRATHDEKDFSFESKGATSQIYGARYDLIVFDDVQSLKNLNQTDDILEKLRQECITRLTDNGKIIIVGTRIKAGDLYERLLEADDLVDRYINIPILNDDGTSAWPERWPLERIDKRRRKVTEEPFQRVYMQKPLSAEGASFSEAQIRKCCDDTLTLGDLSLGVDGLGSIDPALAGPAAFGAFRFDPDKLWLTDIEVHSGLGSNEAIFKKLAALHLRYNPSTWVLEQDGQGNKALVADERLKDMAEAMGFRVASHVTTGNKSAWAYGVAAMAASFSRKEIVLPYGDDRSRKVVNALIDELIKWRSDVPSRLLTQDRVMMTWFAWRWWMHKRKTMEAESGDFSFNAMPYKPTNVMVLGPRVA